MKLCWLIDIEAVGAQHQPVIPYLRNLGYQVVEISSALDNPNVTIEPDCIYSFLGSFQELNFLQKKLKLPIATYGLNHYIERAGYVSYMPDWFLNDSIMTTWGQLKSKSEWFFSLFGESIFVRPNNGRKTFTGQVFNTENLLGEMEFLDKHSGVVPETLIWICRAKVITGEYRFWISNGEVVTYSAYSWDETPIIEPNPSSKVLDLANKVAKHDWQVDRIYTVDITEYQNEAKIIELNSFSCAGLYNSDAEKLLKIVSRDILAEWDE